MSAVEHGRELAGEAASRGRVLQDRVSRAAGGNRVLGLLVVAGVGFVLASIMDRR